MSHLLPIRDVAKRMGCSRRSARRRLQGLDARVQRASKTDRILVRFGERGPLYVDMVTLRKWLPSLTRAQETDTSPAAPEVEALQKLCELEGKMNEVLTVLGR